MRMKKTRAPTKQSEKSIAKKLDFKQKNFLEKNFCTLMDHCVKIFKIKLSKVVLSAGEGLVECNEEGEDSDDDTRMPMHGNFRMVIAKYDKTRTKLTKIPGIDVVLSAPPSLGLQAKIAQVTVFNLLCNVGNCRSVEDTCFYQNLVIRSIRLMYNPKIRVMSCLYTFDIGGGYKLANAAAAYMASAFKLQIGDRGVVLFRKGAQ